MSRNLFNAFVQQESDLKPGLFITFEGGEGAGKSTQLVRTATWLKQQGIAVEVTREPGGTPMAEEIRTLLVSPGKEAVCPDTELLLMFAARAQHLHNRIMPALEKGCWVLCDRFTDSTYAYQGVARAMGMEKVAMLEKLVQGPLRPDVTFLLDMDVRSGMERARARSEFDRFEQEDLDFFEQVRSGFLQLARENNRRFHVLDAAQSEDALEQQLQQHLQTLLQHWQQGS